MPTSQSPLVEAAALAAFVTKENTVFVDARSGPDAYQRYLAGHLAGAIHADLDRDLSRKPENPAHGGRHPLPDIKTFAALLGAWGIAPATQVVVYDDKSGANAAARFWWMLRAVGHKNVQVVNGGLDAIVRHGLPLTTDVPAARPAPPYPATAWSLPIATLEEVEKAAQNDRFAVVDVREAYRYRGEREPIDLVAGHIPGAINIPYLQNLDEQGNFLSPDELLQHYEDLPAKPGHIIVHCGSGVTACHTLLALEHAGISEARLYVGSWSEWSRRDKPIATGEA